MGLVVGINIAVNLRLLGVSPRLPIAPLARLYPLHWAGALLIFLSGLALLLAYPAKALTNPLFYLKLITLCSGLVIARSFQLQIARQPQLPPYGNHTRMVAAIALVLWLSTISAGRFLAYTHSMLLASRFY